MASRPLSSVATTSVAAATTVGTAVPLGCKRIRLECTQDCYVTIGQPVLAASAANGVMLRSPTYGQEFGVTVGDSISVIRLAADGILNTTFMGDA